MAWISSSGLLLIYKQTLIRIVFLWGFFLSFFLSSLPPRQCIGVLETWHAGTEFQD